MIIEVMLNDLIVPVELKSKTIENTSEFERIWEFNTEDERFENPLITFKEQEHILQEIMHSFSGIKVNSATLETIINDFLKEELERKHEGIDDSDDSSDEAVQPYDPKKISIRTVVWSLSHVVELISKWKKIDLNPDFQREFIWDYKRKSRLIESLMLNIPIPAFYLAETKSGISQVVDGLQRLTTITEFLNNEFPLKYLEYLREQEGKYFETNGNQAGIDGEFQMNILQTQFTMNIIDSRSPIKVKYDVFRRINTGGKPLNNQEIRNCLASTETRIFINRLAESDIFKQATGYSIKPTRMEAQEFVLRFIAFWYFKIIKDTEWEYKGNMTEYLDNSIELLNSSKGEYFEIIENAFYRAMENAFYLFGEYSFRKCLPNDLLPKARKQLINKSLFTTLSITLSNYEPDVVKQKVSMKSFSDDLANLLNKNAEYLNVVSYKTNAKKSIDLALEYTNKLVEKLN
jgi:hypothetical protein